LHTFVTKCHTEANKYGSESIAFPALGTGILKFPSDIAASIFIRAIKDFVHKHPRTSISDIRVVVYGGMNCQQAEQFRARIFFPWLFQKEEQRLTFVINTMKTLGRLPIGVISRAIKQLRTGFQCREPIIISSLNQTKEFQTTAEVVSVMRNENLKLYEEYFQECQRLYSRAIATGPCKSLANTPGSRGPSLTMQYANRQIANLLDSDLNEVYLFHGTKKDRVNVLLHNGFDLRLAAMNFKSLWLGAGVYAAEEANLSAQYT
ncbi:hypothetical protein AM593_08984, partial [Mytilus galloprovincialis]